MCVINLIEIFKFDIEMSYGNDNSHRKGSNARDKASKSASASLKEILFEVIAAHINENAALSPLPSYFLTLIETLSLLWFLVHPTLNLYALDDYFVSQINLGKFDFMQCLRRLIFTSLWGANRGYTQLWLLWCWRTFWWRLYLSLYREWRW